MNILMLGWELPPHGGGMGVACYHMSKALALQGADINFVVPYDFDHSDIDFMKVHSASSKSPGGRYGGIYDSQDYPNSSFDLQDLQKEYLEYVEKFVVKHPPEAIHAHDWLTMEAGARAKELSNAPLIVHVHATEFDRSASDSGNQIVHEIEYNGLMMADRIIAVSNNTKAILVQKYKIPAEKIEVVHNAFDPDSLDSNYKYDERTYTYLEALKAEGYTIFSYFGRFTVQKGLVNLIRAFAKACSKYDHMVLLLVGSGEQRDELVTLASDLGIADKLFITGWVQGKQWRDAYSVSEVLVMSSVSEPFGLSALEAAHHGNALIITKQSGVGEVLHSVFRYDFWDEKKLADQMVGLALSPVLRHEMSKNVMQEYNRLSWKDVATSCISIYNSLRSGVTL